jgi:hypothetical protein
VNEEHWPGEKRLAATEQDELGSEEPEVDSATGEEELPEVEPESESEPALPEEQLEEEAEQRRDGDTPVPERAPAE